MLFSRSRFRFVTAALVTGALLVTVPGSASFASGMIRHSHKKSSAHLKLVTPGVLSVGSDTTYPPMEFSDVGHPGQYKGADVDIANALAKHMGLKGAKFISGGFDSLLSSLQAGRFDVIISAMNDTPARRKIVNYVDYMTAAEGILVPAGSKIRANAYTGLCHQTVSAQRGSTELYGLQAAEKKCHNSIHILGYVEDTEAYQAFISGHATAYTTDWPVVIHYYATNRGRFRIAGKPIVLTNYGIAVRKNNPALEHALQKALAAIRADGEYLKILKKWGLGASAIK